MGIRMKTQSNKSQEQQAINKTSWSNYLLEGPQSPTGLRKVYREMNCTENIGSENPQQCVWTGKDKFGILETLEFLISKGSSGI